MNVAGFANRLAQMQMQQQQQQQLGMNQQLGGIRSTMPGQRLNASSLPNSEDNDEETVDEENMGVAETYADYMPTKLKLGRKHPDPVVETASLASVSPPDVLYRICLPEDTINSGSLSALQLEAITYACQQHERLLPDQSRAGYLIGDGAGVGKQTFYALFS